MLPRPSRPRLADVAARAGVSTASVSLVLRGKPGPSAATREAVLGAAAALGYRPDRTASLLARRRTQLLGVTMDVNNPFHAELLDDLQAVADSRGYDVVISPVTRTRDERRAVETLLDFRCEALLLLGPSLPDQSLAALAAEHVVVVVGRRADVPGVGVVRAADDRGVALAVEHLARLGHRDIAFADGPRGAIATLRRQGYRTAMRRLGLGDAVCILPGGDTEAAAGGTRAGMGSPTPTAVIAFNDRLALGLLDQLRRIGVEVPRQLSVVGYDDSPLARLGAIDLTSVSQDPETMAEAAVRVAVDRLEGSHGSIAAVVLDPHLAVRGTTGAPGAPCPR